MVRDGAGALELNLRLQSLWVTLWPDAARPGVVLVSAVPSGAGPAVGACP